MTLVVLDATPIIRRAKEQDKKWIAFPSEAPGFMHADVRLETSDLMEDVLEILSNSKLLVEDTAAEVRMWYEPRSGIVIKVGVDQPGTVEMLCRALWSRRLVCSEDCDSGHICAEIDRENDEEYEFSETHWLTQDDLLGFLESHHDAYEITLGPFSIGERLAELSDGFSRLGLTLRRQEGVTLGFLPGSYLSHKGLQAFMSRHGAAFRELVEVVHDVTGTDPQFFSGIGHELKPLFLPGNGGPTPPTR